MYEELRKISRFFIVCMIFSTVICFSGCSKKNNEQDIKTDRIIVYLKDGLSESELNEIEARIKSIDGVVSYTYISKADALKEAKEKLGKDGELLNQYSENNHPFPASYSIVIKRKSDYSEIINEFKALNGVKDVDATKDLIKK